MANLVDPLRHLPVFDPQAFGDIRIDVIGCGATGSRIALSLAKLGVTNLHVHDFDTVEEHNVANQAFGIQHIGQPKVVALADLIKRDTGLDVVQHCEPVTGKTPLGHVVFLVTDTMESRKDIWLGAIKNKLSVGLMVETRMGTDQLMVYTVEPCNPVHVKRWESTLYTDAEAEVSACGTRVTVGPTAELVSGMAVWQFLNWQARTILGKASDLANEVLLGAKPVGVIARAFKP